MSTDTSDTRTIRVLVLPLHEAPYVTEIRPHWTVYARLVHAARVLYHAFPDGAPARAYLNGADEGQTRNRAATVMLSTPTTLFSARLYGTVLVTGTSDDGSTDTDVPEALVRRANELWLTVRGETM